MSVTSIIIWTPVILVGTGFVLWLIRETTIKLSVRVYGLNFTNYLFRISLWANRFLVLSTWIFPKIFYVYMFFLIGFGLAYLLTSTGLLQK